MGKLSVTVIGAGNMGFHLAMRLWECGIQVKQVFSRDLEKAQKLASAIHSTPINNLDKIDSSADIYLLAIVDDAIARIVKKLTNNKTLQNKLIAHTSGATSIEVFKNHFKNYGNFYPLQSFSLDKKPNFSKIPICICANHKKSEKKLSELATKISSKVFSLKDEDRTALHVAAVFANNFSNCMYQIGHEILKEKEISFELIKPLILETAEKVQLKSPKEMQTGPAARGDQKTINSHLKYLENNPKFQDIYLQLTQLINPQIT